MTPEALRDYIVDKGFSEDIAQEVIIRYLRAKCPIRHPKSWAWKTCVRLKNKWQRQADKMRGDLDLDLYRGSEIDALRRVMACQELARAMEAAPDLSKRRPWGWNRCREDYDSLQKLT